MFTNLNSSIIGSKTPCLKFGPILDCESVEAVVNDRKIIVNMLIFDQKINNSLRNNAASSVNSNMIKNIDLRCECKMVLSSSSF